jgi:hypothetical protein
MDSKSRASQTLAHPGGRYFEIQNLSKINFGSVD